MNTHHISLGLALACLLPMATYGALRRDTTTAADTTVEQDLSAFTGTIQSLNTATATLVVSGHEVHRKDTVKKTTVWTNNQVETTKPKKAASAHKASTKTFQVPPLCNIATTLKSSAFFSDLKVGDKVEVEYHTLDTNAMVADSILPAKGK